MPHSIYSSLNIGALKETGVIIQLADRELISNMAANAQQFGNKQDPTSRKVNEVNISSVEQHLDKITSCGKVCFR